MTEHSGWMSSFRRALIYLRPQRRRIVIAVGLSVALALTFAASLGAVVPVLKLLISNEGPRAMLFHHAVERQYGLDLRLYEDRHGRHAGPEQPAKAAMVVHDLLEPLPDVRAGDALYPLPQSGLQTPLEFLEFLAAAEGPVSVQVLSPSGPPGGAGQVVSLSRRQLDWKDRISVQGVQWVGRLLPTSNTAEAKRRTLLIVFSGLFISVVLSAIFRFVSEYLVVIISNRAVMDMRRQMYRTIMQLPMTWFGRHLTETMSRVVTDFKDIERGYRALFGKLTQEPVKIVVLLMIALAADWRITVFVMVAAPIGGLLMSAIGRKVRKANRRLLAGYARMMSVITAALSGMRVVRAYDMQTAERRRMWSAERGLLKQLLKIGRLEAMAGPLLEVLGVGAAIAGVIFMAEYVFTGELTPDSFLLLILLLVAIFNSARTSAEIYPRLARADAAAHRVFEMIDMPVEQRSDHQLPALPPLQERIELRDVTFTYSGQTRPALDGVTLTVLKGQKIALVGPNGSGKTTTISLLERFFECNVGQILFDGRDIARHDIQSIRGQISLLTQDAVVFAISVFENIAYGTPNATAAHVVHAAQRAHAHEFIERLPEGYDTVLGEFGATLSGGERQRLCLARAILRDAPIFIFDEATSQIDVDSERKIHAATREFMRGRTSFVIAHRIGTITDADQIAVFDMGRLVDVADHPTLMSRCELYRTLYQAHAGSAGPP